MPRKKNPTESAGRRKRAYELPNMINLQNVPQDPIRQIEAEALQDLADEYKTLKMEQLIEKRRQDVARMRIGVVDGGPMASNADFMKMAQLIAPLSPEEQQNVARAYAILRMADKGQLGGSMQFLGPLLGFMKQNPDASQNQMLAYLNLMDGQFSKGLEVARAMNPGPPEDGTLKLLSLMKDLLPLLKGFSGNQQQGVFDAIFLQPDVYNRLRESGIFGGNSAAKSTVDIELEKLRGERQLQIKKWDLEMHKDNLTRQAEDRRTETLLSVFAPLATAFAGPVSQRMQQLGEQQAAAHMPPNVNPRGAPPPNVMPRGAPPTGTTILVQCNCGYEGSLTFPGTPPPIIKCPGCDLELNMNPPATA